MARAIDELPATWARIFSSQAFNALASGLAFCYRRPALLGALAADLGFDRVEFGDPLQGLGGDRRRGRFGKVEELPAPVCPAEGERRRSPSALGIGEGAIAGIAVGLQHTGVALQKRQSVIAAAPRRVAVDHRRRRPAPPRPVIAGDDPEVTLLGAPSAGVEHWGRGLV